MAALKKNTALLLLLISLFLTLTFAHDDLSPTPTPTITPTPTPTTEEVADGPSPATTLTPTSSFTPATLTSTPTTAPTPPPITILTSELSQVETEEVADGPSPGSAPVSYISSSPDSSPASSPASAASPLPSDSSSSASPDSSSAGDVGVIYGALETTVTAPIDTPAVGKDIQAQVSKVVQASVIAVKAHTEQFMKNVIAKRLADPSTEAQTRECLNQCKENYSDANDDISRVMEDLSSGDYYKAMVDVEGISTFVDTCYDCLHEMVGDEPEFKKFDDWVKGVTGDCLEQLDKINS